MPTARVESISPSLVEADRPRKRSLLLRALWDYPRQMISLGGFVITGLVVCPVCTLLLWCFGDRIPASTGQGLIRWLFDNWLGFSQRIGVFDVRFPEAAELQGLSGAIVAPNHPSQLDAVILLIYVPRAVCIMRASLMQSPWLGGAARLARFVANDHGPALIRQTVEKIGQGENLLIFPEGTRTRDQPVNSFKPGFALIAQKSGAPIHTIIVEREGRYLAKGVSLLAPSLLPITLRVRLGEVITPRPDESAQDLSARLEVYFRERLVNTGTDILYRPATATHS